MLIKDRDGKVIFQSYHSTRKGTVWAAIQQGISLKRAFFLRANLRRAKLSGADLRMADLREARLRGADLSGADLSGADLTGADLYRTNLTGTNLTGAELDGTILGKANLIDSIGCDPEILKTEFWRRLSCG